MQRELTIIPQIKIHPNQIILYNTVHWEPSPPPRKTNDNNKSTLIQIETPTGIQLKRVNTNFLNSSRSSNGIISKSKAKKLRNIIEYFLLINKDHTKTKLTNGKSISNKVTFITLTLPSKQIHTDNDIKKICLNQFLIELQKYHKVTQYIWRAEYQKNGNIHFHILVNRYIWWNDIRNRWNRIINKLGYVDRYRQELKEYHKGGFQVRKDLLSNWNLKAQYKAYKTGQITDWSNPNTIDIHGIKKIINIKSYLTKYLTKNEIEKNNDIPGQCEVQRQTGRIWGSSTIFTHITGSIGDIDNDIDKEIRHVMKYNSERIYSDTYYTVIDVSFFALESMKCFALLKLFLKYMQLKFNFTYQMNI